MFKSSFKYTIKHISKFYFCGQVVRIDDTNVISIVSAGTAGVPIGTVPLIGVGVSVGNDGKDEMKLALIIENLLGFWILHKELGTIFCIVKSDYRA